MSPLGCETSRDIYNYHYMFKLIIAGLLVFLGGIGIGVFYQQSGESGGVGPQSALYALDTAEEWIRLNLITWNESGRLELRVQFMQERLDELTDLVRADKLSKKYAEEIGKRYAQIAEEAREDLKEKMKETASAKTKELLRGMEITFAKQQAALEEILRKAPSDAEGSMLNNSFAAVKDAYRQVIGFIKQKTQGEHTQ